MICTRREVISCIFVAISDMAASRSAVLDLTKGRDPDDTPEKLPGAAVSSSEGTGPRAPYPLPLLLKDFHVLESEAMDRPAVLEVVIKNVGSAEFLLPASLNARRVEKQGNKGRRVFLFQLQVIGNASKPITAVVESTDGALSVPGSLLSVRPQQEVAVRFKAELKSLLKRSNVSSPAKIQVKCAEWTLADEEFFIAFISETAPSNQIEYSTQ